MQKTKSIKIIKLRGITNPNEALSEDWRSLNGISIPKSTGLVGEVFEFPSEPHPPKWAPFLNSGLGTPLKLTSQSASALLVLQVDNEWFAIPFGFGGTKLDASRIESRFGLKCALNRLGLNGLRGIDTRTLESEVLTCRKQRSKAASAATFRLEKDIDLVHGLRGYGLEGNHQIRLAGADGLEVVRNVPFTFSEIADVCREYLKASKEVAYKQHYGWVDHIVLVKDLLIEQELNALLLSEISSPTPSVYLAEPTVSEFTESVEFSYSGKETAPFYPHLELRDFVRAYSGSRHPLTVDQLLRSKIYARHSNEREPHVAWPVFEALVAEIDLRGCRYLLNSGRWYQVAVNFLTETRDYITQHIRRPSFQLPTALWDENEEAYNIRAASQNSSLLLMDRVLDRPDGAFSGIEFADLVGLGGQLIHVKFKSGAASLNHLFSQGAVAAETILHDKSYRDKVLARLRARGGSQHAEELEAACATKDGLEVVFAVICTKNQRSGELIIPFFSEVSLRQRHRELERLGIRCSFLLVEQLNHRAVPLAKAA